MFFPSLLFYKCVDNNHEINAYSEVVFNQYDSYDIQFRLALVLLTVYEFFGVLLI